MTGLYGSREIAAQRGSENAVGGGKAGTAAENSGTMSQSNGGSQVPDSTEPPAGGESVVSANDNRDRRSSAGASAAPILGEGGTSSVSLAFGGTGADAGQSARAGTALGGGSGSNGGSDDGGQIGGMTDAGAKGSLGGGANAATAGMTGNAGATAILPDTVGVLLDTASCTGPYGTECNGANPCLTLFVPGARFEMGRSDAGTDGFDTGKLDEQPEHPVIVSPFWLDQYEVTVGRFRRFVDGYDGTPPPPGSGEHPRIPGSGWQAAWNGYLPKDHPSLQKYLQDAAAMVASTWSNDRSTSECLPMNYIDWYLAFAFCIWDSARLPTEAEWEFAAAGGNQNRLFPWGSEAPDSRRAVYQCSSAGAPSCQFDDSVSIGSTRPLGDGLFAQSDLAGSLYEFTRDGYGKDFYSFFAPSDPNARIPEYPRDPRDAVNLEIDTTASEAAVRGGSYVSNGASLRAAARWTAFRTSRDSHLGVRCARNR